MWCPRCGAEYRRGFTHCPDCDVELVDEPPPEPESGPVRRVTRSLVGLELEGHDLVAVFVGPPLEAEILRSVLDGSGIPSEVWSSGFDDAYPSVLGARLMVAPADAERATEVVGAARSGELDLDPGEEPELADDDGATYDESIYDEPSVPAPRPSDGAVPAGPVAEVVPWWRRLFGG